MMKINRQLARPFVLLPAVAVLLGTSSAVHGWILNANVTDVDSALTFTPANGGFDRTTLKEGVRADTTTSGGIPVNDTFQSWDGSNWPSADFSDSAAIGGAAVDSAFTHQSTSDEFFDSAEASLDGNLPPEAGASADWFYDFELVVDPGASVTVELDGAQANGYVESESGDAGNAFVEIKLYAFDAGINDPGGVNNPFADDDIFVSAPPPGQIVDRPLAFSHTFDNPSGSTSQTLNLRLEGSTTVFEDVPEPTTAALLGLGGLTLLTRRSQRRASRSNRHHAPLLPATGASAHRPNH